MSWCHYIHHARFFITKNDKIGGKLRKPKLSSRHKSWMSMINCFHFSAILIIFVTLSELRGCLKMRFVLCQWSERWEIMLSCEQPRWKELDKDMPKLLPRANCQDNGLHTEASYLSECVSCLPKFLPSRGKQQPKMNNRNLPPPFYHQHQPK